jgi:hypothetical protein
MSKSTFNASKVNSILQGSSLVADWLADDPQVAGQRLRVPSKPKFLADWASRHLVNAFDLGADTRLKLDCGWEFSVARFCELACGRIKTIFGFDETRRSHEQVADPGAVNTGRYQPFLAWLGVPGLRVQRMCKPDWLKAGAETRVWLQAVREWLKAPTTLFASVDEDGVTVLEQVVQEHGAGKPQLALTDQFASIMTGAGFHFGPGDKLDKRAKPLTNLWGYIGQFGSEELQVTMTPGVCDGAITVTRKFARRLELPDDVKAFTIRLYGPQGLIKGVAVVNEKLEGLQVLCDPRNLKAGVSFTRGYLAGAEPKRAKAFCRTDIQTQMCHSWLMDQEPLEDAAFTEALEQYRALVTGTMDVTLDNCVKYLTGRVRSRRDSSVLLESQFSAFEWRALGLELRHSWGLSTFILRSHLEFLRDFREGELSTRMACSVRCQPFNESFALQAGLLGAEEPEVAFEEFRVVGFAEGDDRYGCVVVSDARWAEMFGVHQTPDCDDDFNILFRTVKGVASGIFLRSPCGPGEYTILRHHQGDWAPETTLVSWEIGAKTHSRPRTLWFPEVSCECPPARLNHSEAENQLGKPEPRTTYSYGLAWLVESASRAATATGVGALSNLLMCWAAATNGEAPPDQLASPSDVIDLAQAGGSPQQARLLEQWLDRKWLELNQLVKADAVRGWLGQDPYLWNLKAREKVWDAETKKLVKIGWFRDETVKKESRWLKAMQYTDQVLKLFLGDRETRQQGKLVEWLKGHFETHPAFEVMARFETEETLAEGVQVLKDLRAQMAEIEQEFEVKTSDPPQVRLAKERDKKAAYRELDVTVEHQLLEENLLVAVAVAIYRSQSQKHRDGMLFATPRVRRVFLDWLGQAMAIWNQEQDQDREDLETARQAALAVRRY